MPQRRSRNHPAEVFGHPIGDRSEQARRDRANHWCPFLDQRCTKQSRNLDYPFGVCSVRSGRSVVATCPTRFREGETVFAEIADHYFGTRHDVVHFSEVSVRAAARNGRPVRYTFDYVLVKHRPLGPEIEDFVVVEFQTVDTTGTGGLVTALQDLMGGEDIRTRTYSFGLNMANVWKRCFTQILRKGTILEQWGHNICWVVQEPAYRYLVDSYGLQSLGFNRSHKTAFMVYDLDPTDDGYHLARSRIASSTVAGLFRAFQQGTPIPPKD